MGRPGFCRAVSLCFCGFAEKKEIFKFFHFRVDRTARNCYDGALSIDVEETERRRARILEKQKKLMGL